MTGLGVSDEVGQAFPGLRIAVVVAYGFDGQKPWPEVDAELAALEKEAADGQVLPDGVRGGRRGVHTARRTRQH